MTEFGFFQGKDMKGPRYPGSFMNTGWQSNIRHTQDVERYWLPHFVHLICPVYQTYVFFFMSVKGGNWTKTKIFIFYSLYFARKWVSCALTFACFLKSPTWASAKSCTWREKTPGTVQAGVWLTGKKLCIKRPGDPSEHQIEHHLTLCPCGKNGKCCPALTAVLPAVKEGDPSALLNIGEATPGVLGPVLGYKKDIL